MGYQPRIYWRSKLIIATAVFLMIGVPAATIASSALDNTVLESLNYISKHQDSVTGGIIEVDNDIPSEMISAWSAMAYNSAGYSTDSVIFDSGSPSLNQYLQSTAAAYSITTDVERYILAQASNNSEIGSDYIQQLIDSTAVSGLIGDDINSTIFGVLAYSAAGLTPPAESVEYIINAQETGGCWNSGWSCETNITAQATMALIASGIESDNLAIVEAQNYLTSMHIPGGGIKYDASEWTTTSDAFSDAYTLQALNAIDSSSITPYWQEHRLDILADLNNLRRSDGSYDFSSQYGAVNPVWTTSIVLIGLTGHSLPVIGSGLAAFKTTTNNDTIEPETIATTSVTSISSNISSTSSTATNTNINSDKPKVNKVNYYLSEASNIAPAIDAPIIGQSSVKGIYYDNSYQPKSSWWEKLIHSNPLSIPGATLYLSVAAIEAIIIGWFGALLLRKNRHA